MLLEPGIFTRLDSRTSEIHLRAKLARFPPPLFVYLPRLDDFRVIDLRLGLAAFWGSRIFCDRRERVFEGLARARGGMCVGADSAAGVNSAVLLLEGGL